MSAFTADLELLQELVDRMAAFEQRFETLRQDVDTRIQRMHAVWTGQAAGEQAEAHQRWTSGAAEMHESLAVLRSIATTARENYSSATRANQQMWSCR